MKTGWRSSMQGCCAVVVVLLSSVAAHARPMAPLHLLVLNGVYCTSANNCWAVGSQRIAGVTTNQVLHFAGSGLWQPVTVPNPGGTADGDSNTLFAVRCTTAANCWAVGYYQPNGLARRDQVLHWKGKRWSLVSAPAPGGTSAGDLNQLADVACTSAKSCWAVGNYGIEMSTSTSDSEVLFSQALHWNGAKWSLVSTPNPGGRSQNHLNELFAVRCAGANNCWAAGSDGLRGSSTLDRNLMLHWNGASWKTAKVPSPGGTAAPGENQLKSLSCTGAKDCWAAGSYGKNLADGHTKLLNQLLRWNGSKWVKVAAPNPDGTGPGVRNQLLAVTCTTARDCWAVGWTGGVSGRPGLNEALHWTGSKWSLVATPDTSGAVENILASIRCTSSASCWSVGTIERNIESADQILRWNGVSWMTT